MKFYCDLCGIKFESKSGNTKYCPECRKRRKEKPMVECQACGKVFLKTNNNMKYCPQCRAKGNSKKKSVKKSVPRLTLAQVCREARAAGLSYGQYVVRMEQISGIRR